MLALLFLIFSMQYVDRTLVSILIEPIKQEFGISDSQAGFLSGMMFGIPYAIMILPVGYLVDRMNRKNLLALALAIWSGFTVLSSFARSMIELSIARALVAGAEAANNPSALSMLSDLFDRRRRSTAIGIFFAGPALATLIVFPLLGVIAETWGWRRAFLAAGVPGLILALLLFVFAREPVRERSSVDSLDGQAPPIRETLNFMRRQSTLMLLFAAMTLTTIVQSSHLAWMAPLLMRAHGLALDQAMTFIALTIGVPSALGQMFGGAIVQRLSKQNVAAIGWACAASSSLAFLLLLGWVSTPSLWGAGIAVTGWAFCIGFVYGPAVGAIQTLVLPRMRGIMSSCYGLIVNLVGAGLGPLLAGVLSDGFASAQSGQSLQISLAIIALFELGAVLFFFLAAGGLQADFARAEGKAESMTPSRRDP